MQCILIISIFYSEFHSFDLMRDCMLDVAYNIIHIEWIWENVHVKFTLD